MRSRLPGGGRRSRRDGPPTARRGGRAVLLRRHGPLDEWRGRLLVGRHEWRRLLSDRTEALDVVIERAQIRVRPAVQIEPGHGRARLERLGEHDPLSLGHVGDGEAQVGRVGGPPWAPEPQRIALEPLALRDIAVARGEVLRVAVVAVAHTDQVPAPCDLGVARLRGARRFRGVGGADVVQGTRPRRATPSRSIVSSEPSSLTSENREDGRDSAGGQRLSLRRHLVMIGQHLCHARRHLDPGGQIQELVRAMGVRARAHHASDEELRLGEALAEHAHERDRAADALVHCGFAEVRARGSVHRLGQPRVGRWGVPAIAGRLGVAGDASAVRRVGLQQVFQAPRRPIGIARGRQAQRQLQRGLRSQDVAAVAGQRQPRRARDRERGPPGVVEEQLHGVVVDGPHAADERILGDHVTPERLRDRARLLDPRRRERPRESRGAGFRQ